MTGPEVPPVLGNALAAQSLTRFLGLRNPNLRFEVLPVVMPVAVIENPDTNVMRPAIGTEQETATGGNFAHIQILNPAGSQVNILVEAFYFTIDLPGLIQLRTHNAAFTTLSAEKAFRDASLSGAPVGEVRSRNGSSQGSSVGRFAASTIDDHLVPIDWTLVPGTGLVVLAAELLSTLDVTWFWTEEDA